jgi:hypothetical protein
VCRIANLPFVVNAMTRRVSGHEEGIAGMTVDRNPSPFGQMVKASPGSLALSVLKMDQLSVTCHWSGSDGQSPMSGLSDLPRQVSNSGQHS